MDASRVRNRAQDAADSMYALPRSIFASGTPQQHHKVYAKNIEYVIGDRRTTNNPNTDPEMPPDPHPFMNDFHLFWRSRKRQKRVGKGGASRFEKACSTRFSFPVNSQLLTRLAHSIDSVCPSLALSFQTSPCSSRSIIVSKTWPADF